jgi:GNAT superfamily N-acetyltransferase
MDEIQIRPATAVDIPEIVEHRRRMFADMGRGSEADRERMAVATEAHLRRALPAGTYRGWLAETPEGRVVAGAGIEIAPWPGWPDDLNPRRGIVMNVYTAPEFRRRGIARRLMDALLDWCRADGFGSVFLHASEFGRPLYEAMGFQPTNEMRLRLK